MKKLSILLVLLAVIAAFFANSQRSDAAIFTNGKWMVYADVIIGCGATGTVIANHFARAGVGQITIVDRDFIELNNLQRQLLFDEQDLVELTSPDYPGERLIACRNPLVANKNRLIREELLQKTEAELEQIAVATKREKRALKGADVIGVRVGKVINRFPVGKFLDIEITEESLTYRRKESALAEASALDGVYLIRTSLAESEMSASETVQVYK